MTERLIQVDEVTDVLEVREALERTAAARVTALRIDPAVIAAELREPLDRQAAAMAAGDMATFMTAGADFHLNVVALSGNRVAERLFEPLRDHQLRLARLVLTVADLEPAESFAEHLELGDRLREHDFAGYSRVLDRHLARHQGLL
ncbi:MAG TPA: FCD domain-containing protein [Actinoplanes sp.]|nr:FCD domain-containing protein [Actinoplanes sp.]